MKKELYIFNKLHKKTSRDYISRMTDDKVHCMNKAKGYEFDYWDGDRRYGYGGYSYDGRWKEIAEDLIKEYKLTNESKVLDVGCGKAFLLYELTQILPEIQIEGFDISKHGINDALDKVKDKLYLHKAQDKYKYENKTFDLVISLGTLHNLKINELKSALQEIERVGKNKFIMMEGYRNDQELFNLQCWALTCESFFKPDEWTWMFDEFKYTGDYEFIYFE